MPVAEQLQLVMTFSEVDHNASLVRLPIRKDVEGEWLQPDDDETIGRTLTVGD